MQQFVHPGNHGCWIRSSGRSHWCGHGYPLRLMLLVLVLRVLLVLLSKIGRHWNGSRGASGCGLDRRCGQRHAAMKNVAFGTCQKLFNMLYLGCDRNKRRRALLLDVNDPLQYLTQHWVILKRVRFVVDIFGVRDGAAAVVIMGIIVEGGRYPRTGRDIRRSRWH